MNQLLTSRTLAIASSSIISIGFIHYLWGLVRKHNEEEEKILEKKNDENMENNEEPKAKARRNHF